MEALEIVHKHIHITPIDRSRTFSSMSNCEVYLKYENLQKTGAFKVRGALYKVYKLSRQGIKGVVAASAGNHAQGVAYAAKALGMRAVIVMPLSASIAKVEATRGYGAEVVLYGEVYDDAEAKAREIAQENNLAFVHPFDDIDVMAGQATIAWELFNQLNDFDAVIVPIGGGGLASGILSVVRKVKPSIRVIGVEPSNAPKMLESLRRRAPTMIEPRPSLADGLVTKKPGEFTFTIISNYIDDIVTVGEDEIALAIHLLLERAKVLAEGAGAAALAALISGKIKLDRKRVVVLVTGGNIDLTALYRVIIKGLLGQERIAKFRGFIPDVPGALYKVLSIIAKYRGNIIDIKHDRYDFKALPWHATVEILVEVPSKTASRKILEELQKKNLNFELIE